MDMMYCSECINWVRADHIEEWIVWWQEYNKTIEHSQKTIKGYVGELLQYDVFVSPHEPIKVPSDQRPLYHTLIIINKKIDQALSLPSYTMPQIVWNGTSVEYQS